MVGGCIAMDNLESRVESREIQRGGRFGWHGGKYGIYRLKMVGDTGIEPVTPAV